jgi:hypothetical protein
MNRRPEDCFQKYDSVVPVIAQNLLREKMYFIRNVIINYCLVISIPANSFFSWAEEMRVEAETMQRETLANFVLDYSNFCYLNIEL